MNCRDYERLWNELLDSETCARGVATNAGLPGLGVTECERALLQHAAECAACGRVGERYQLLRRAIRVWGPPLSPSAGLADRILAEIEAPTATDLAVDRSNQRERLWPTRAGLAAIAAAAAVVLAIALPTVNRSIERVQPHGPPVTIHNTPFDPERGSATIIGDRRASNCARRGDCGDVGPGAIGLRAGRPDQSRGARRGHSIRPDSRRAYLKHRPQGGQDDSVRSVAGFACPRHRRRSDVATGRRPFHSWCAPRCQTRPATRSAFCSGRR